MTTVQSHTRKDGSRVKTFFKKNKKKILLGAAGLTGLALGSLLLKRKASIQAPTSAITIYKDPDAIPVKVKAIPAPKKRKTKASKPRPKLGITRKLKEEDFSTPTINLSRLMGSLEFGKPLTEEHKQRISEALKRKKKIKKIRKEAKEVESRIKQLKEDELDYTPLRERFSPDVKTGLVLGTIGGAGLSLKNLKSDISDLYQVNSDIKLGNVKNVAKGKPKPLDMTYVIGRASKRVAKGALLGAGLGLGVATTKALIRKARRKGKNNFSSDNRFLQFERRNPLTEEHKRRISRALKRKNIKNQIKDSEEKLVGLSRDEFVLSGTPKQLAWGAGAGALVGGGVYSQLAPLLYVLDKGKGVDTSIPPGKRPLPYALGRHLGKYTKASLIGAGVGAGLTGIGLALGRNQIKKQRKFLTVDIEDE